MDSHTLIQALIYLGSAALIVPIAVRLGLGSVLGYLIAGCIIGPWGLRLVEYEERAILANEVKIRVRFGAPKHGTEVVDFRAASPFIDEDFNGEWQMFSPRPANAPRGIEFGKFQLGNMVVGDIIECGNWFRQKWLVLLLMA